MMDANAILCVSDEVAAQLPARADVEVVPDTLPHTPHTAVGAVVRKAMRIDPDALVVAVVGRIAERRGQALLARALAAPPLAEIAAVGPRGG